MYGSLILSNSHSDFPSIFMYWKLKISWNWNFKTLDFDRKFDRKYTIADNIMWILGNGLIHDNKNSQYEVEKDLAKNLQNMTQRLNMLNN